MKTCLPLLYIVFLFLTLHSCNKSENGEKVVDKQHLTNELVKYYYTLQLKNKYDIYIDHIQSCDSTSLEYRNRIQDLLIHHKKHISSIKKGVDSISVSHIQYNKSHNAAHIFLNINYKDKSSEEILFPLIYKNNEWKMR